MALPQEGKIIVQRLFRTSNKLTIDEPGLCPRIFRHSDVDPRNFIFSEIEIIKQIITNEVLKQVAPVQILDAADGNVVFEVDVNGNVKAKGRFLKYPA